MLPKDVVKNIRRIEIRTKKLVNDVFSGEYHSVFKGRGMEFQEVREYQVGDDIRIIDWNVTARYGYPFVKRFREERELTIILLMDASFSQQFGSRQKFKNQIATELCSVLAFSAIKNNDKVGMVIFTDKVEKYIKPQKGYSHVLRLVRDILYFKPQNRGTDINSALEFLIKVTKRRSVVFLVSDFLSQGYERLLSVAGRKHDLIPIRINDRLEAELPKAGLVELEDAETGEQVLVDTSSPQAREDFWKSRKKEEENLKRVFASLKLDNISISTDKSYVEPLISFFKIRAKKLR